MNAKNPVKKVRLVDIAEKTGVSRAAVAKVLLGSGGDNVRVGKDTSERIRRVAQQMGYKPNGAARQLKGISSRTIGVVLDTRHTTVMTARLFALEEEAARRDYRLLIGRSHQQASDIADFMRDFESRGVEGLICLFDMTKGFDDQVRALFDAPLNMVFHGRHLVPHSCCVRVDTASAIHQLYQHLTDQGKDRIGMELWNVSDELMTIRKKAFLEAQKKAHNRISPDLIWSAQSEHVDPAIETVERALDYLVDQQKANAIIASNDIWAVRIIQQLKLRGLNVPRDVAVTGYDNLDISTVIDPPLTTIDQQHRKYASAALDLLLQNVHGPLGLKMKTEEIIDPLLITRGSTINPI